MENVQKGSDSVMEDKYRKSMEVEGNTIEEAIKKAAESLNVSRGQICVKIVCEEKKGLFGMKGAKPAKIRVTLKEK